MIKTVVITHNPVKSVNLYGNKDINYWKRIFNLKRAMLIYSYPTILPFLWTFYKSLLEYEIMHVMWRARHAFENYY